MKMKIKVFVTDVDGTLTDGKIHMGNTGELFKSFDIKDGMGLHELLPEGGITPVIITGRTSEIVTNRAKELEIPHVQQGVTDKKSLLLKLAQQLKCTLDEIAYIGDDLNDLECIQACGVSGCPNNAVLAVREAATYICKAKGGEGAVREFIDWILSK